MLSNEDITTGVVLVPFQLGHEQSGQMNWRAYQQTWYSRRTRMRSRVWMHWILPSRPLRADGAGEGLLLLKQESENTNMFIFKV